MLQALKFFGYVRGWNLDEKEIYDEMDIMASMNHVESVVRNYGYFMDTVDGLIPWKLNPRPLLPVIVMEHMSGGPLFGRLNYQENVSEKYLATVFKAIVVSANKLHEERFIHRDLKLENIMFLNNSENSPVRIIDLGMSAKLNVDDVFIDKVYLVGTPGFYAPESITNQEYSVKTDIWQLGCILYMLLSGLPPFHRDKIEQITSRGYYKMSGKGWADISDTAKDLVQQILKRKPADRLTVEQILAHPWMIMASSAMMDDDYKTRIKRLALREKMQNFFCESKLSASNAERQKSLMAVVPMLRESTMSVAQRSMKVMRSLSRSESTPTHPPCLAKEISEFNGKLKNLKTMVVRRMSTTMESVNPEINYDAFVDMLTQCRLDELCTPAVFNIFDIGNTGTVDPKEFMMTMIAFRPVISSEGSTGGDDDIDADARLYFDMFDIKETGFIDMDELRLAVKFLLFMGTDEPQDLPDVEDMFNAIDLAKNGRIDYDEFKIFYKQLLTSQNSSTLRVS